MIRAFVFDICDTLVRTGGVKALLRFPGLPLGHSEESLSRWFTEEPLFYAYEKGEVSSTTFLERMLVGLELATDLATLRQAYEDLIVEEIAGVPEILAGLKGDYSLYALSNNNPLLWQGILRISPAVALFDGLFLSHEIGLLKPDPNAFDYVLGQIDCAPEEAVLVDDNPECVCQARSLGWQAVLFKDAAALENELKVFCAGGP
jgi:HAD superfamily hydrolase (TIGR01509 family)